MSNNVNRVMSSFQALKTFGGSVVKSIRTKTPAKSETMARTVNNNKTSPTTSISEHNQVSITQLFSRNPQVRKKVAVTLGKQLGKNSYQLLLAGGKKGVKKILSLKPVNDKVTQLKGNRNFQDFLLLTNSTYRVVQNASKSALYTFQHFGQPRHKLPTPPPTTFRAGDYVRVLQREERSLWLWVQFSILALPGSWALYKVTSDEHIKSRWREYILTTKEQLLQRVNH